MKMHNPAAPIALAWLCLAVAPVMTACTQVDPNEERLENMTRGEVVVAAIQQYEDRVGSPPLRLLDLVPDYLAEIPKTYSGLEFEYSLSDIVPNEPWVLMFRVESDNSACGYLQEYARWDCSPPGAGEE